MSPTTQKSPVDRSPLFADAVARRNPAVPPVEDPPENIPDPFIRYPKEEVKGFSGAVQPLT